MNDQQGSVSRRRFIKSTLAAGAGAGWAAFGSRTAGGEVQDTQGETVMDLRLPPMDRVRVGLIGLGARGAYHLGDMLRLEGVEVTALCDTHEPSLQRAVHRVGQAGRPAPHTSGRDAHDYRRMLERDDVDIVYISTPWEDHAHMCVDTMNAGKHAFVEVPAAITVEECWQLVDTSERTQRHCMMLENVNYGREELMLLNMVRQGLFGELLHAEAAYIHELRGQMHQLHHGTGSWRTPHYAARNGNLYPTHGLGPVAQYMGINRSDRFDYMSSVSSPALGRALFAETRFDPEHRWNLIGEWKGGDINTSIIKTALGRSIMVQWDETTPRPYDRLNFIQGTSGCFGGFPNRIALDCPAEELPEPVRRMLGDRRHTNYHHWDHNMAPWFEAYDHPLWRRLGAEAARVGGHGGMDFLMNWRVIQCLRDGEPLDQSVYDAAAWSVIGPLSEWSVAHRSQSVDIPDFTRGVWKTTEPFGVVS